MSLLHVFDIAGSGMNAQSVRLNTVASNLSNVDSIAATKAETYRAKAPVFSAVQTQMDNMFASSKAAVRVQGVIESSEPLRKRYEPSHPYADKDGYIYLPNVNAMGEMANMISASRTYQTNVQVLNTAKKMMQQTLNLGR